MIPDFAFTLPPMSLRLRMHVGWWEGSWSDLFYDSLRCDWNSYTTESGQCHQTSVFTQRLTLNHTLRLLLDTKSGRLHHMEPPASRKMTNGYATHLEKPFPSPQSLTPSLQPLPGGQEARNHSIASGD